MDIHEEAYLQLWRMLNEQGIRFILVGGLAVNFHDYQRFTGVVDIYIEESLGNRKRLRKAYKAYCNIDFESFETIRFVLGWVDFPLTDGTRLDIMTNLVGVDATFDECLKAAKIVEIDGIKIPVLHINHLIANKKAVGRPKDQLDVMSLEAIQELRNRNNQQTSA
jgi:predicted nucleotidyltransferase